MGSRILIAEDDPRQAEVIRRYVVAEGHDAIVVHDGRAALDAVRRRSPDLLVLDVMMPKADGLDVCRVLRGESGMPVLMLTARASEEDLLTGLDVGADDYLTKPYNPRELMARIRALLRRARPVPAVDSEPVLTVGEITIDAARHEVRLSGYPVRCTPGEFGILAALAARPDQVFTRRQLLQRVGGGEGGATERTIDVHIANLRRKLEQDPRRPLHLVTVHGVGYKLADGRPVV